MQTSLCNNIDWVGYIDWNVRDFHSYVTSRGATYNSYLIRDEKTALIDTVKYLYADKLLENIQAFTSLDKIDYIIMNHAEPDHASGLSQVMQACPQAEIYCTAKCIETISRYQDSSAWKVNVVKTGETLSLGNRSLTFVETPMVHWPDSMVTYCPEEKILFSMDAFGQHFSSSDRFDDEVDICAVMDEAKTYYANIVMPYGKQVQKTLEVLKDVECKLIAPAHGIIWRSHMDKILSAYKDWCVCKPAAKVVVVYDTMWQSTAKMADAMVAGAEEMKVDVKPIFIRSSDLTTIATEVLDAACVAIGSSTLNQTMMPMASAALTYLKGLRPTGKAGFAFGSYGWGRGGPEAVHEILQEMKWDVLRDPLKSKYKPDAADLDECREAGRMLATKALELAGA